MFVDRREQPVLLRLRVRPRLERVVGLDPPDPALVLRVVVERAGVDHVLLDPLVPVDDGRVVGEERQHPADLRELHPVGRVAREHPVLGRVERLGELQVEQLVLLGRVGLVRVEEDGRELAAGELAPGAAERQPVVALQHLHVLVPEVQAGLPAVVDHAGDVPLERLVVLVPEEAELLGRVDPQLDPLAVGDEPLVDEQLLAVADVERGGRGGECEEHERGRVHVTESVGR